MGGPSYINQANTANVPSIASATTAIASNVQRRGWNIQNLGMNVLFVRLGASASSSVFHFVLKAGAGNDDGSGGSISQSSGVVFTGEVSIAGTSPRYAALEL